MEIITSLAVVTWIILEAVNGEREQERRHNKER